MRIGATRTLVLALVCACGGGGNPGDDADDDGDDSPPDGGGGKLAELVTTLPDILSASIALAPDGSPRIAMRAEQAASSDQQHLLYAEPDGDGGWTVTPLPEPSVPSPERPGLVIDSTGTPHVLYESATGLLYARRQGTTWSGTQLSGLPLPARPFSIAIGPGDSVHIAVRGTYGLLTGSTFATEPFGMFGCNAAQVGLAIDSAGTVHFVCDTGQQVVYATGNAGAFTADLDVAPILTRDQTSIAVDSKGSPHIAASAFTPMQGVFWVHKDGADWTETQVSAMGNATKILVDGSDAIHVFAPPYQYERPDGAGGFMSITLTATGLRQVGDLAVAPDGTAHGLYTTGDSSTAELHYVRP